ncbi:MAG TPA: pyridoxamine 5'-phosphate oxidase family protein [Longimicrobium sp.]|nr:pyridoxamine 5'-phosphate oxidase family protein [Longimicrobium sp.]
MAKVVERITDELRAFIQAQPLFFVGTAPLAADGHVNLSPKGLDCLRVLGPHRVAYLDLTGSGNETSAHLAQNGRITLMFCAFQGPPSILRLYGRGAIVLPGGAAWGELLPLFPDYPGVRQIITVDVHRVQTSCGFAVPRMEPAGDRDTLLRWALNKGDARLAEYRQEKNARSIDGLPAPLAAQGTLEADGGWLAEEEAARAE